LIEDRWVWFSVDRGFDSNGALDEPLNILKTLSPKEEKVIRLRFGIGRARATLEKMAEFRVPASASVRLKPRRCASFGRLMTGAPFASVTGCQIKYASSSV